MSLLQDIIDELNTGSYSSDDVTALGELQASGIMNQGPAPAGLVLTYLAEIGKLQTVEDISNNSSHPLQNAAKAVVVTYSNRTEFEFQKPTVQAMCQAFVDLKLDGNPSNGVDDGILTQVEKDNLEAIGQTPRFEQATLRLVREARGKTNTQTLNYEVNKNIKLTVTDPLHESVRPYITYSDGVAADNLPLGATVNIDGSKLYYEVDLKNLRLKLRGSTVFTIELGAPNSFTVEMV
jgi:hypothetical protein